jgi:hypothetical protein
MLLADDVVVVVVVISFFSDVAVQGGTDAGRSFMIDRRFYEDP